MGKIFAFLAILFIGAIIIIFAFVFKAFLAARRVQSRFAEQAESFFRGGRKRQTDNNSQKRERIIPPEYAEDVTFTEESVTGKEDFLQTDDSNISRSKTETQVSDAEYDILK